ncbi:MAG: rhodanese-like domain-containing protein [Myxococcota bacterium]
MPSRRFGNTLGLCLVVGACSSNPPAPAETPPSGKPAAPADAAQPAPPTKTGLPDRDPALAHRLVEQEGALLLDVRSPDEFAAGHIEGARNIPHDQLRSRLDEVRTLVEGNLKAPIVVYCRSGRRSGIAKETLLSADFEQVTNLGGMNDW